MNVLLQVCKEHQSITLAVGRNNHHDALAALLGPEVT
jgi:hypothetical protein